MKIFALAEKFAQRIRPSTNRMKLKTILKRRMQLKAILKQKHEIYNQFKILNKEKQEIDREQKELQRQFKELEAEFNKIQGNDPIPLEEILDENIHTG